MLQLHHPSTGFQWVPQDIVYGIPLFNSTLNQNVCARIANYNLFSQQNLAEYRKNSRILTLRLLNFISTVNGTKHILGTKTSLVVSILINSLKIESGNVPLPNITISWPPDLIKEAQLLSPLKC